MGEGQLGRDLDISGQVHANSLDATRAGVQSARAMSTCTVQRLYLAATDVGGRNVKLDAGRNLTLAA